MQILQIKTGEMEVYSYILACGIEALLIDPGGDEAKLLETLQNKGLALRYIVNTHCHPDHTCANERIREETGAQIVMHEEDQKLLYDPEAAEYFSRMGLPLSPPADLLVHNGDTLEFGECHAEVIHTPGHSPGSICLLAHGNLFTGDTLFVGSAGRVDLPQGSFPVLIDSLEKKISCLPPSTIIWPGHDYGDSPTSTVGKEKIENPYLGGEWPE